MGQVSRMFTQSQPSIDVLSRHTAAAKTASIRLLRHAERGAYARDAYARDAFTRDVFAWDAFAVRPFAWLTWARRT